MICFFSLAVDLINFLTLLCISFLCFQLMAVGMLGSKRA